MKKTSEHPTKSMLYRRAAALRRERYYAEVVMWNMLKNRQFYGYKFRRQHVIGSYIADFVCLQRKFIIELDGDSHEVQKAYDAKRTRFLTSLGYRVYRINNQRFLNSDDRVDKEILTEMQKDFLPTTRRL
jgi:5-methyltetrahydrofolate--homocysteine methyltransferase